MEKKKASALASILALSLILTILAIPLPTYAAAENHKYWVIGGETNSDGQLGTFDPWNRSSYLDGGGVPFATRPPYFTPKLNSQNITFTDKDPVTGAVQITVPKETYTGLNHTYWSPRVGFYFNVLITLDADGCGWIFTGEGTSPVMGCVDYVTYNNNTGVYTYGPDQTPETGDDELLAGKTTNANPPPDTHAAGAGPPIGPCCLFTADTFIGTDGIPGTDDDAIGRGDPDGPDPIGSSILYLPTTMTVTYFLPATQQWVLLFSSPWPQLLTTGTAYDKVIEPESIINGWEFSKTGQRWEFLAGADHAGQDVDYGHPKWNAYVTYACAWSVLDIDTALGDLDVHFYIVEKKVREDCVISDISCDEKVTITDVVIAALAFGAQDEYFGSPVADPNFDPRGDFKGDLPHQRGKITISDIVAIALDFGASLTPACIIRP